MERDLVYAYKAARERVEALEEDLTTAKKDKDTAQTALLEHLEGLRSTATGKYEGLWVQIETPRLYASATQEVLPAVLAWLKDHGHTSAVKETVHPSTLSQIIGELLREGTPLPEGVTYFLQPRVRLYGGTT